MTLIPSQISPAADSFKQNHAHNLALCEQLREQKALAHQGGLALDGAEDLGHQDVLRPGAGGGGSHCGRCRKRCVPGRCVVDGTHASTVLMRRRAS